MRKILAMILSSAIMVALVGCNNTPKENRQLSPPEDFSVCFSWWYVENGKNIMDTGEGILQKDLVLDGTASVEFQPDQDFLKNLYDIICEGDLLTITREMTSRELTTDDMVVNIEPSCSYEIAVRMNGDQFLISGDDSASLYTDEDALCFMSTVHNLMEMTRNIPEWATLPKENGGYV